MLITCSSCQSKIRVPDSAAGKKGKCPKCGSIIAIPLEAPAEDAPPEPVADEAGGSPFDFSESAPPPKKAGRKAAPADDEIVEEPADVIDDEGDQGRPKKSTQPSNGLSITALVLGILSLVCGCGSFRYWCAAILPLALAAGALGTGYIGMNRGGRTLAIVGMSLAGVSILLNIIGIIVSILVWGVFNFGF